jgi:hypothetical protein
MGIKDQNRTSVMMNGPRTRGMCGLSCAEDCSNHILTLKNDRIELEKAAKQWSEEDGKGYSLEDIICHGCWEGDEKVASCAMECAVRRCARDRGVENCGRCGEYPCSTIKELLAGYSASAEGMVQFLNIPL